MRVFIFAAVVLVAAPTAMAQGALQGKLVGCANIADAHWHACFDALTQELKQVSEAQFSAPAAKPSALTAPIGATQTAKAAPAEPDQVSLEAQHDDAGNGRQHGSPMENELVWKQSDTKQLGGFGKGPWTAEIRKAMGGSFLLQVNGGGTVGVKRVK